MRITQQGERGVFILNGAESPIYAWWEQNNIHYEIIAPYPTELMESERYTLHLTNDKEESQTQQVTITDITQFAFNRCTIRASQ